MTNLKVKSFQFQRATSRSVLTGLLLCLAFFSSAFAQSDSGLVEIKQAQAELNNGDYSKAIQLANQGVEKAKKIKNPILISEALDVLASSQISLALYVKEISAPSSENYENEAMKALAEALQTLPESKTASKHRALIYSRYAWLFRTQKKFTESLSYSKKAVAVAPEDHFILAAHYLNTGRIMFAAGYDVSAIVWLEKAEKLLESEKTTTIKLDTYRFLSLAWWSKLNYQIALKYAEKFALFAEKSPFKYKHRQSLIDLETILSESGQEKRATLLLEKGLKLSLEENNHYQACNFLTALLLHSLDEGDTVAAVVYLNQLEKLNLNNLFTFEIYLGKAVISAFRFERVEAEKFFTVAEKQENSEEFLLLYWKTVTAQRSRDWQQFIKSNEELLALTTKDNFRSGLPKIYLNFARAYFHLNQPQTSVEHLQKALALIEEIRKSENYNLSLALSENYHDAYRLLAQIKLENAQESFELADFLKARLLKDRIDNAAMKSHSVISPAVRKTLEELSLKYIDDQNFAGEIEKNEKLVTATVPELNLAKPDLAQLDGISELNGAAVVSYFFTLDKKLLAFVKEKGQPVKTAYLNVSEDEIDSLANTTEQKIKSFIFFKRDGKEIYDKLLKPLNLNAKHLIIVPDKSLWKIPFQALSADGEKYLIEDTLISYAPSVSILLEQLKKPKPNRQTLQAYANSSYEDRVLQFVNAEASSVAGVYGSKPILDATVPDFARTSDKTDILHFSMHAQVDKEQPLNSFLGFRKVGADDGRLTTEELLNVKLKKGSLAFLASCDTNNVLSGEGLVSLAWAMMGSGATTVVSAQWEANDKSTEIFTKAFYTQYKQGGSAAEAMQKASLELIKNKSQNMHDPYYWADFTLNGDYR